MGLRFYNSNVGRWVSRDPIGERIPTTLYVFCRNCVLSRADALGLLCFPGATKKTNETYQPPKNTVPWTFDSVSFEDPVELHSEARGTVAYAAYACHYKRNLTKVYSKLKCCWFQWVSDGTGSETEIETRDVIHDTHPDVILIYGANDEEPYKQRCKKGIPPP